MPYKTVRIYYIMLILLLPLAVMGSRDSVLTGKVSPQTIFNKPFAKWSKKAFNNYKVKYTDQEILKIKDVKNIKYVLVLGTWCGDSKREVPQTLKILYKIYGNYNFLTIYGIDKSKTSKDIDIQKLKIEYVPTLIVYMNGAEAGRIVEHPIESQEKDLMNILFNSKNEENSKN